MSEGHQGGSDENVVRLPTDWLGSRDDLVPIRPRAHARDDDVTRPADVTRPTDEPDAPTPLDPSVPTADDFWSASASALHHAIQGPAPAAEPPARRRRLPRLRAGRMPISPVWALVGVGLSALAAAAVIGTLDGTGSHRSAARGVDTVVSQPPRSTPMTTPQATHTTRHRTTPSPPHRSSPPRRHTSHRRRAASRPRATHRTPTHHASSPTPASHTVTAPPATVTTVSAPPTTPTATTGSAGTTQSPPVTPRPRYGSRGTLGPGQSPDG